MNAERTLDQIGSVVEERYDLTIGGDFAGRFERRVQRPVGAERVLQETLRDQHLSRAQHAAPAAVARVLNVVVAVERRKVFAVREPKSRVDLLFEWSRHVFVD